MAIDAPPHSLKNSNVSQKVETMEEEGVRVCSLTRNTLGLEGHVGARGWGLKKVTSGSIFHTNQTTSWLVLRWSTFGAQMNHGHTWTHKIHHGPNLGEATTFPLLVFSMHGHGACTLNPKP
jgi:hypothetical protein